MADISLLSQLQSYLAVTSQRQTVISSNMANVDTPGYQTRDIDFQSELQRAFTAGNSGSGNTALSTQVSVHNVGGLLQRADGNNVDIDRESLLMAETQLQYQAGTQLLKQRFHQLLTAINSGS